jgi:hypothetical protein
MVFWRFHNGFVVYIDRRENSIKTNRPIEIKLTELRASYVDTGHHYIT